jgi:hypothetical protein
MSKEDKFDGMRKELDPAQIDLLGAEQEASTCELDHSGDPRGEGPYPANNTLMVRFDGGMIPIHVCGVCGASLAEENSNWYLFICFGCMATKWLHKSDLHRDYTEQIVGMNECPDCASFVGSA